MKIIDDVKFHSKWKGAKRRCESPKSDSYAYYGRRGIRCLWDTYNSFVNDMYDSYLEHVEKYGVRETTLDRIDSDGNYCKENCRWVTNQEQQRNRSSNKFYSYKGITMTIVEWSEWCEMPRAVLRWRIVKHGIEKALQTDYKASSNRTWKPTPMTP